MRVKNPFNEPHASCLDLSRLLLSRANEQSERMMGKNQMKVDATLPRGTCSGAARATTLPRRATTRRRVCGPWTRLSLGASWWVTSPTWTAWRGIPTPTTSPRVQRIAPSGYGTCRRASASASSLDTAGECAAWPCRPTANPWRAAQTTAGYGPTHPNHRSISFTIYCHLNSRKNPQACCVSSRTTANNCLDRSTTTTF